MYICRREETQENNGKEKKIGKEGEGEVKEDKRDGGKEESCTE